MIDRNKQTYDCLFWMYLATIFAGSSEEDMLNLWSARISWLQVLVIDRFLEQVLTQTMQQMLKAWSGCISTNSVMENHSHIRLNVFIVLILRL
jgi:hypothetical protein